MKEWTLDQNTMYSNDACVCVCEREFFVMLSFLVLIFLL